MNKLGRELGAKIRDEYGTMRRFCRLKGINYNSLRNTLAGMHVPHIKKTLIKEGLATSIEQFPQPTPKK